MSWVLPKTYNIADWSSFSSSIICLEWIYTHTWRREISSRFLSLVWDWLRHNSVPSSTSAISEVYRTLTLNLKMWDLCDDNHRRLTPRQIMLDGRDRITLIDFGFAHFFDPRRESLQKDSCGSLEYVSPESIMGHPYLATKSDSWSVGVTLYTLLFGFFPYAVQDIINEKGCFLQDTEVLPLPSGQRHSEDLRRKLSGLLCIDPKQRSNIGSIIWLTRLKWREPCGMARARKLQLFCSCMHDVTLIKWWDCYLWPLCGVHVQIKEIVTMLFIMMHYWCHQQLLHLPLKSYHHHHRSTLECNQHVKKI